MVVSIFGLPEDGKTWAQCKTGDIVKDVTIPVKSASNTEIEKNDIIG